jgi:hypothetical protein
MIAQLRHILLHDLPPKQCNITDVTSGSGAFYRSRTHDFIPGFSGVRIVHLSKYMSSRFNTNDVRFVFTLLSFGVHILVMSFVF